MKSLTPDQRATAAERRAKFKALWKEVAQMPDTDRPAMANKFGVVNPDGHPLSCKNMCLLFIQIPTATVCGGFRQWLKHGRAVKRGQHGAMIWVPLSARAREEGARGSATAGEVSDPGDPATESDSRQRFIIGTVFDISQTEALWERAPECGPTKIDLAAIEFPGGATVSDHAMRPRPTVVPSVAAVSVPLAAPAAIPLPAPQPAFRPPWRRAA